MDVKRLVVASVSALSIAMAACATGGSAPDASSVDDLHASVRDWDAHPAIVQLDGVEDLYALSDPHGGYDTLGHLLQRNGLIDSVPPDPDDAAKVRWTGGKAVLVVAGDLIDKGEHSLGVIDLLRTIEAGASAVGGRVVVTLGNHEAEFFVDPHNHKATSTGTDAAGIDSELAAHGIDPQEMAAGRDAAGRGQWLLNLPFGVRVNRWFFAHSGNTGGDSIAALETRLRHALDGKGWKAKDIVGDDSILEAEEWYGKANKGSTGTDYAKALGVDHIAFGHDPGALKDRGRILSNADGSLVKLNVNMGLSLQQSTTGGLLLHVRAGQPDEVLDAAGHAAPLPIK